jgi:integrase
MEKRIIVIKTALQPRTEFFARAVLTSSTRRAYASDLKHFVEWGGKIPSTSRMLADYAAHCADWYSVATTTRRLMAIRHAHVERNLPLPTGMEAVKAVMRGIRRERGVAQRQARPLTRKLLRGVLRGLEPSLIGSRDRALLLIGFAGGFRRSELVGLNVEDLERGEEGIVVHIRRSKTDQEGRGRAVAVPRIGGSLCPVAALESWLRRAKINSAAVFRRFDRYGHLTPHRLNAGYVSRIVKARLRILGVDPKLYSSHSIRAGLITEAARAGVPSWRIRRTTGHKSDAMVARYVRDAELWEGNAATAAFRGPKQRGNHAE